MENKSALAQQMEEEQKRFYNNFVKLAKDHHMSLAELARRCEVATSPITKWKHGAWPDTVTLKKIANYFNITIDELLGHEPKAPDDILLGDDDKRLVRAYRRMTAEEKGIVNIIVSKYED